MQLLFLYIVSRLRILYYVAMIVEWLVNDELGSSKLDAVYRKCNNFPEFSLRTHQNKKEYFQDKNVP